MRTRLLAPSLAAFALLITLAAPEARADVKTECPQYRAHVLRAKAALEAGDRATAVSALRSAQQALRACANRADRGTKLVS